MISNRQNKLQLFCLLFWVANGVVHRVEWINQIAIDFWMNVGLDWMSMDVEVVVLMICIDDLLFLVVGRVV